MKTLLHVLTLSLGVLPVFAMGQNRPPRPVDLVVVAMDRSESTAPFRPQQERWLDVLIREAASQQVKLLFYVYAGEPVLAWGPGVPTSIRQFRSVKIRFTRAENWHITRQAALLDSIAKSPEFVASTAPRVFLLGDGDDDDFNDKARLSASLKPYSRKLHATLSVIGIADENKTSWTKPLALLMPGRYDLVAKADGAKFIFGSF
jgi:hypothetical protein